MLGQINTWTTFLVVVLLQNCLLIIVNAKDDTRTKEEATLSQAEEQEKKSSDLDELETTYYNRFPIYKDPFSTYNPIIYRLSDPSFSYYPSVPIFPMTPSVFSFTPTRNTSDDVHRQFKCGDAYRQLCQDTRHRTYDGSCNNLRNPTWGMANTRYGRLVPARYADGIQTPPKSVIGRDLPLSRAVSYTMFPTTDVDDVRWTLIAMQYGQFLTHDMGLIDGTTQSTSHQTRCCTSDGRRVSSQAAKMPQCFPILIPKGDPVYGKTRIRCLNFVRSSTDHERGCSSTSKPAEQLNTVTHYLDLSLVYGSNDNVAASLRAGFGGRLRVAIKKNKQFPPKAPKQPVICDTTFEYESCYATGDTRANQNPQLAILQIMLLREHNRIADYLASLNPHWTDETIFQETRRITIAEHQNIIYYEWLPIFLGVKQVYDNNIIYNTEDYVNDYDETVVANVLNEHSNAANRYFHSNIAGFLNLVTEDRYPYAALRLSDHFNKPGIIEKGNNLDDLARGCSYQPQKDVDINFDKEIKQFLFRRTRTLGSDLRAIDIQRGRDHGLASYNDYREYCGLPRAQTFANFSDLISSQNIQRLSTLYDSPDDVDLTVGASLERHVTGALAGPTFICIMVRQFKQTRVGDRYWFETGDPKLAFTQEQLNELRKASISRLLCDNGNNIQNMQRFGFIQVSESNPIVSCDELPEVDLSLWKDYGLESDNDTYQHITPLYNEE